MKKIKKIILSIIVSLIALISVFSCVKGKYTPEPILNPVSVLKPANSVNDNVISPTGTYEYIYFNTSLSNSAVDNILNQLTYTQADEYSEMYYLYVNNDYSSGFLITKIVNVGFTIDTLNGDRVYDSSEGFNDGNGNPIENPYNINLSNGLVEAEGISIGQQNNLLINLISPVPFLFEGDINYEQTSSGFEDVTQVESLYMNTNYTNETLKTLIDEKVGYNDISFSLSDDNTTHTIRINNTTYECYIYLNNNYIYIYNYNETQYDVYWYGYGPTEVDNNLLLSNVDLYSLSGWDNDLSFLFSETNNFGGDAPTYEEGYANGYNAGYENGYSSGVNNVTSNPSEYNLYTYNQYQGNYTNGYNAGEEDGYNRGYLDGLDDGSNNNISFQYIESVLTLIGNFLNIEVLPGIKLSYALGVVIILTIISIIKMVVK